MGRQTDIKQNALELLISNNTSQDDTLTCVFWFVTLIQIVVLKQFDLTDANSLMPKLSFHVGGDQLLVSSLLLPMPLLRFGRSSRWYCNVE